MKLLIPWLGVFLLCSITTQAQYTINPGPNAATQFTTYLNQVQAGGSITFTAGSYSIAGGTVTKAITITGAGGSTDVERTGAANNTSVITFTGGGLKVASSGVTIKNLEIKGVGIKMTGKNGNLMFDNLLFTEVTSLEALMLNADQGFSGTVQYCTFDNFKIKALVMNRRAFPDEELLPGSVTVNKCVFTASDPTADGVRGISIDAGNDENPNPWDLSGTIFTSNTFNDCGVAFSKCSNFTVGDNNIFNLTSLFDSPVHLEEFCTNAVVNKNLFEIKGAFNEGLISLGARQPSNNIKVSNNSVTRTGTANPSIKYFVTGTAMTFIDITGNTISNNVSFGTYNVINFVKGHPESCGGCKNINITGNTGIAANKIKIQYEGVLADQNIANVPVGTVKEAVSPCNRPKVAGTYFIRSVAGGNLSAAGTGDAITFSNFSNDEQRWKLEFVYPLNYTIESYTRPDYYIEVIRGAFKDEVPGFGEKYYGDTKARLVNHTTGRKPGWVLENVGNGELKLVPGGNEFASRLSKVSDAAWLSLNKINGVVQSAGTADKWIITTADDPNANNLVYEVSVELSLSPNPASAQDVVRIQGEGIQSVSIWSLQGKEVFQQALPLAVSQFSIPLSYIESGVYVVHIGLADGSSKSEKLIIR